MCRLMPLHGSLHHDRPSFQKRTKRVDLRSTCPSEANLSLWGKCLSILLLLFSFLPSPSLVVAFSFDDKVELVVRAGLFLFAFSISGSTTLGIQPLPHPHCESTLIEQRRRLNCLRLACTITSPHVLSNIILIRKTLKSLVLASVSYSAAYVP
jgi:hypothetical protein